MRKYKVSSGDMGADHNKYLSDVPKQDRITSKIVRTGKLTGGVYQNVKVYDHSGKLVYSASL